MEKRIMCKIIAVIGLILIVLLTVIFTFRDKKELEREKYLIENIKSSYNKCIKDNKCSNNDTTINELNIKGYINKNLLDKLKDYSDTSYINYNKEVILIKQN